MQNLNTEQKQAVLQTEGPVLIIAGAGTGKTTVLTQKIVFLIKQNLAKPEEILAVTFTDKAAEEMEQRVDDVLTYGYVDLWISTFHSFCERVLRDYALDIGLPADFKILDQVSAWSLIYQNFDKFNLNYYKPLGNPTKFIKSLITHFSQCKDQEIYPEDYLEYAEKLRTNLTDLSELNEEIERIKEIANAFHIYQNLLLQNNFLDFGDLINFCLKLFRKRLKILKKYQEKFKYILVDEFQDTNWAQYELVKMLAQPRNNLTVCCDDDQSIYKFRGASFSNIIQFKKDFPQTKQISLIKNYRSCQNILDLAYKFIKTNNPDRLEYINKIDKKLIAEKPGKGIIEHIYAKTLDEEAEKTIKKILEILKKDKNVNYNDFVILVRANNNAAPFIKALERIGLPYQFLASKGLYTKPIILDIISYFKLLDNYHENSALYRILNLPFLKISLQDIVKLTQYSYRKTKSLYEAMEESALIPGISENTRQKIIFILSMIKKHTALAIKKSVSEILLNFLEDSGYLKYLTIKNNKQEFDLLNQFHKRIKKFEETTLDPSLNNFIKEIILEIESGEEGKLEFDPEQGPEMIKVMTIHGAKGLEFKYVFLVNMVDKRFPAIERKELIELPDELIKDIKPKGDIHLQEERRICYVAMTRAKKGLYFTSAEDYGGQRKKKLSRFLIEMGYKEKNSDLTKISIDEFLARTKNLTNEQIKKSEFQNFLPKHFSFSQLVAFEKCPLQYKLAFILKIPVKGKASFSFGKTMHAALYIFLKSISENSIIKQNNLFGIENKKINLDFNKLLEIYEKNWIDDWYENKNQKNTYYELGKKILRFFYNDFLKNSPKILKINNILALEIPFNLKIGKNTLYGIIDRIDELENGEAVIIDYKTGNVKEKLEFSDKEQLLIYQIAAKEVFKIKPKELIYYFLSDNEGIIKKSFLGTEKEIEQMKQKILQTIEKIKKSDFKPTPGWQCQFCDFKNICEFAEKS